MTAKANRLGYVTQPQPYFGRLSVMVTD